MAGFDTGFNWEAGRQQQQLERKQGIADEQRRAKAGFLYQQYQNATDEGQKAGAQQALKDLYPPEHANQFMQDIKSFLHVGKQPTPQVNPQAAAAYAAPPTVNVPTSDAAPQNPWEIPQSVKHVAQARTPEEAVLSIPSTTQAAETAATQKEKSAATLAAQKQKDALEQIAARAKAAGEKQPSGRPVPFFKGAMNQTDAAGRQDAGFEFKDENGETLDATKIPPNMILVPVYFGKSSYWTVADDQGRYVTADNQKKFEPAVGGPTQNPPSAGVARVPTVGTHQVPGMNPGEKLTMTSTQTPVAPRSANTPQVPGAPPPTKAAPQVPVSGPTAQAAPPKSKLDHPSHAKMAAKAAQASQSTQAGTMPPPPPAFAGGTFQTQGKTTKPVVSAMNTVAAQVFGGNGDKPIWDYAYMYDNPRLAKSLNKALTLNALSIPGTEDDPTFMQTLGTAVGVTGWSQEQIRNANANARQEIRQLGGDDALEMFSRLAGFQEDLTALRRATGSSAAQGAVKTMVRAAPIYNVSSSQDFRNQLAVTLNTASAALSGYPEISKQYTDWWKQGARMAKSGKQAPLSSRIPQPPTGGPKERHYNPQTGRLE